MKSSATNWRTNFSKTLVQNVELNYYMTENDLFKFIDHFKIGIVLFNDYKHPKEHFKDRENYIISDCSFYMKKQKHMFEYCNYFMILVYFDNIHYDVFYNQESKKAIYSTKEGKEREFVRKMCNKQNLFNIFGEKDEKDVYTPGWESFLEKHSDKISIEESEYINNKWIDIAEGTKIIEDNKYNNKAVVRNYTQKKFYDSDLLIQATDKSTKEVKYFDLTYFREVDDVSIDTISESTDEILLVAKKYFWHQKLMLENDGNGIHVNQYLYSNTGFTWKTSEDVLYNFYRAQMLVYSTYEKKQKMYTLSKVAKSRKLRTYLDFYDMEDIDESYISQQGKEFKIFGCLRDMLTYYYYEFFKKTLEREDRLLFLTGVTRSIRELFGEDLSLFTPLTVYMKFYKMDIDKDEVYPKEKFYRVMILCLDLYKGDRDKESNTIYSTIKKGFLYYIGATPSKFNLLKKQILIEVANKFENIDQQKLCYQRQIYDRHRCG